MFDFLNLALLRFFFCLILHAQKFSFNSPMYGALFFGNHCQIEVRLNYKVSERNGNALHRVIEHFRNIRVWNKNMRTLAPKAWAHRQSEIYIIVLYICNVYPGWKGKI